MSAREGSEEMVALRDAGRLDEALAVMRRTAEAYPDNPEVRHNLGVLLSGLGRPAEAEPHFRAALAMSPDMPDIRYAFAVSLLAQGRFAEGWPLYDGRIESQNIPVPKGFPFPRWAGEDPAGKTIAVFPEQGFGDQIQFARFAPLLQARGATIVLLARPALVDLFAESFPDVAVLPADGAVEFPDPDFWVMSSDLPALAGCTLESVSGGPYLRTSRRWEGTLPPGFKIGLATRGNPHFAQDGRRSLDPASADLLRASLPGTIVSLDPADSGARDFADTAALIGALDLVIAVDTGVAHLAGALGTPCSVLLQGFGADWRWLLGRADSPWYDSVRLYRAALDGDWRPVIAQVAAGARRRAEPRAHGEIQTVFPDDPMDTPGARRAQELMEEAYQHRKAGRIAEALTASHAAIEANPANPGAVHNLGVLLSHTDRLEEGEALLRDALALLPGQVSTRHSLGLNLLRQGRYAEGWALHRARTEIEGLTIGYPRNVPFPHWEGEPLAGKRLALFPEQGFGDLIQFARFVPALLAMGATVTLLAPPPLVRLFQHNLPGVDVIAADGATDFPDPDFWATLLDLPGPLGVTLETIPQPPYLRAPGRWGNAPEGFSIGLATRGDPKLANDSRRSLDLATAERLRARLPGTVVSLDPASSGARDFADTAAMIEALDAVVCVDTSVAHLAGALGKPCFVLIPGYATDWRWLRDRTDSPWYPSLRLYRDTIDGGWEAAIERLARDVDRLAAGAAAASPDQPIAQSAEIATRELIQRADELVDSGRPLEALRLYRNAAEAAPADGAAQRRLGAFLTRTGKQEEGEQALRRAVALDDEEPENPFSLGLNLLGQGRYREAWPFYAARARIGRLRTGLPVGLPCPRWEGEPLAGKRVTVLPEQGLGDQLQFARFVPGPVAQGAEVTMLAFEPLETLFRHSFPDVTVLPAGGATRFPASDYWTTLVELFGMSGATIDTLPRPVYLSTPERIERQGEGFAIGLVTSGGAGLTNDARRSLTADTAASLRARLPGTIVSLDPDESGAGDFAATAAMIEACDLVIAVDTAVAHLAGALGKRCFVLLPGFGTDWRWMRGRDDSPWYPAHRLYRGAIDGDWSDAIDRLVRDVQPLAGEARVAPAPARPAPAPGKAEDWDGALRLSRRAAAQNPRHAGAQLNLAKLLTHMGRTAGGEQAYRRALALAPDSPDARYGLALNLLEQGRYAEAWPLHEARIDVPTLDIGFPPNVPFTRWRGEPLAGKSIAVLPEQGFGDQIQFARFVPELRARGAAVTILTNWRLEALFSDSFADATVVRAQGTIDIAPPDYWATMVDLPARLGATLETLPPPPYLRVRSTAPRAPGFRIGLMTQGNPTHRRDRTRSLSPDMAALLRARLPGTIVSLDPQQSGARDFAETAAIMDRLDLVVSVDTSVAHLAGAFGKRCLVLINQYGTDWRWLRDRADSPWYPSLTLFRGGIDGDWSDAIERLAAEARALAAG